MDYFYKPVLFLICFFTQTYSQNYSLYFNGVNNYVKTSQVAAASNNFTMELWAKPLRAIDNTCPEGVINPAYGGHINYAIGAPHGDFNWGAGHTGVGIDIGTNGVNVFEHAHVFTSWSLVWAGSISGWTHIAIVYENKQPRLYVNGTLMRVGVTSTKNYVHPGLGYDGYPSYPNSGFGCTNGGPYFFGYLDEIRISNNIRYSSDFTPSNIFINDVNTVGLFHFDEGSGIAANDASSLSNNGTIYGATWSTDVLPIELTSFIVSSIENKIILKWITATEVNSYGFDVERKSIGERDWKKIGFVQAHGNSNSLKEYSLTDNNPVGGSKFNYRLKQIDADGKFEYSNVIEVIFVPSRFKLSQNFPNPFNPSTKIQYALSNQQYTTLKIYDVLGNEIEVLVNEVKPAGVYEVTLNADKLSSGVYYYTLRTGSFVETKKMILLR